MSLLAQFLGDDSEISRAKLERLHFETDPAHAEKLVSHMSHQWIPKNKAAKIALGSNIAKVEKAIPEGDPRKTLGSDVMTEFYQKLPGLPEDIRPSEFLSKLYSARLGERIPEIYKYIQKEESSLPFMGGAKNVARFPGYDEMRNEVKAMKYLEQGGPIDWEFTNPAVSAGTGAAFAGAGYGINKIAQRVAAKAARPAVKTAASFVAKRVGAGMAMAPHPLLKLAGIALMAIPEFFAFDVGSSIVKSSEWAENRPWAKLGGEGVVGGAMAMMAAKPAKAVMNNLSKIELLRPTLEAAGFKAAAKPSVDNIAEFVAKNKEWANAKANLDEGFASFFEPPELTATRSSEILRLVNTGLDMKSAIKQVIPDVTSGNMEPIFNAMVSKQMRGGKGVNIMLSEHIDKIMNLQAQGLSFEDAVAQVLPGALKDEAQLRAGFNALISQRNDILRNPEHKNMYKQLMGMTDEEGKFIYSPLQALKMVDDFRALKMFEESLKTNEAKSDVTKKLYDLGFENPEDIPFRMGKKLLERNINPKAMQEAGISPLESDLSKKITASLHTPGDFEANLRQIDLMTGEVVEKVKTPTVGRVMEAGESGGTSFGAVDTITTRPQPGSATAVAKPETVKITATKKKAAKKPTVIKKEAKGVVANETAPDLIKTYGVTGEGQLKANDYIGEQMKKYGLIEEDLNPASASYGSLSPEKKAFADSVKAYRDFLRNRSADEAANITAFVKLISGGKGGVFKGKSREEVETLFEEGYSYFESGKLSRQQFGAFEEEYFKTVDALEKAEKKAAIAPKKTSKGKKKAELVGIAAIAMAPLTTLGSLFTPNEAEAGVLGEAANLVVSPVVKHVAEATGKTGKDMVEEIVKNQLFSPPINPLQPKKFPGFMKSISVKPDLNNLTYHGGSSWWMKIASPGVVADYLYGGMKEGMRILGSPIPELAHRLNVVAPANTARQMEVAKNVFADVPGFVDASAEVAKAMKPFQQEYYNNMLVRSYHVGNMDALKKQIKMYEKDLKKITGEEATAMREKLEQAVEDLKTTSAAFDKTTEWVNEFTPKYMEAIRPLAEKNPSVRIALALDGTMTEKMPELAGMLTAEEKTAVGHLRELLDDIAVRVIEVGENPILDVAYVHHAIHPNANFKEVGKLLQQFDGNLDKGFRLAHLHHRAAGSLQMMPEINYIMGKYLPDVNKRIEMADFWKAGTKNGWAHHRNLIKQKGWTGASEFWDSLNRGLDPIQRNTFTRLARIGYAFEVAMRLALSPSVALKHATKLEANVSNFGFVESANIVPSSIRTHLKAYGEDIAKKLGYNIQGDMYTDLMRAYTSQSRMSAIIADLNLYDPSQSAIEHWLNKFNEVGATLVNFTERYDRAVSFTAAMEMAAKKGMTASQAVYGVMDTVLKTNFLSGPLNPSWLRNPYVRLMFMFQGTPFKILEQRALLVARSGKSVKDAMGITLEQLKQIRADVKKGEVEFKLGVIKDALQSERDMWGTPMSSQLMRKIITLGTLIYGGKALLDADFTGHVTHPPFFKHGEQSIQLNINPALSAYLETKPEEDEWWLSAFLQKWLPSGPVSQIYGKMMRLSNDDIPKIYHDSKLKYLFGVPSASKAED